MNLFSVIVVILKFFLNLLCFNVLSIIIINTVDYLIYEKFVIELTFTDFMELKQKKL